MRHLLKEVRISIYNNQYTKRMRPELHLFARVISFMPYLSESPVIMSLHRFLFFFIICDLIILFCCLLYSFETKLALTLNWQPIKSREHNLHRYLTERQSCEKKKTRSEFEPGSTMPYSLPVTVMIPTHLCIFLIYISLSGHVNVM